MPATEEEVMKIKGSRRLARRLGLTLAVAAVFAPSAQARPLDIPPLDMAPPELPSTQSPAAHQQLRRLQRLAGPGAYIRRSVPRSRVPRRPVGGYE
jgi:hypothetical protein